jgi:hypothetical protein
VVRLPVLGVPVVFMSNDPEAYRRVVEAYALWRGLERYPQLVAAAELRVRIVLHEGTEGAERPIPVTHRMPDADRVIVHTPGSIALVDTSRGDAVAYVTRDLLADREQFQYGILDALTLVLVTTRDRTPVHASMVAREGIAVILAGPSGLGKSTLAYQAHRAGWTVLADDGVYVQTKPTMRLWGGPRCLYLPTDAPRWFGELAGREPTLRANRKRKIAVEHVHDWTGFGPPMVERATVCLLSRGDGPPALDRISAESLSAFLLEDLASVHDLYGDTPARVMPRLCAGGGWRLRLSGDPREAGPLLEELVRRSAGKS